MKRHLFTLILCITTLYSSAENFLFEHLSTDEGLSQVTVQSICQDDLGRMWFATRNGLNCYDGENVKVFRPSASEKTGFYGIDFNSIVKADNGNLYMICNNAFVEFNIISENFRVIVPKKVSAVAIGKNGLWVIKDNEVYKYNSKEDKILLYLRMPSSDIAINSCFESTDGNLWLSTFKNGLFSVDKKLMISRKFPKSAFASIYQDSKGNMWLCSVKDGLIKLAKDGTVVNFKHDPKNENSIIDNFVRLVCEDAMGNIWTGSPTGLCRLNPKDNTILRFLPNKNNPASISYKSILSIFKDKEGTMWFGTYFAGVNYSTLSHSNLKYYYQQANGLSHSVVRKMTEDKQGIIWICTEGGGLCALNPKTDVITTYNTSNSPLSANYLMAIYYDSVQNCLWVGTNEGGLNRFDIQNQKFDLYRTIPDNNENFMGDMIFDIYPYKNKLFIASNAGVIIFNTETGKSDPFFKEGLLSNIFCKTVFVDSHERLWIGFSDGLVCYNLKTNQYIFYEHNPEKENSLSGNAVNSIFEDSKHRLWFGTAGYGLNLFEEQTNSFKLFNEQNGLLDNNILAIAELYNKSLLVSTNRGISRLNLQTLQITNTGLNSWYPLASLNERSLLVSSKNEIYLGSVSGMAARLEVKSKIIKTGHSIFFTTLFVDNKEIHPNDKSGILTQSLPFSDKINLKSYHSVFSIGFATNDFNKVGGQFQYRLKGLDKQWLDARKPNIITYTNLSPGNYELEIKTINNGNHIKTLLISIEPPFYRTIWAYIFYFVLASISIYYLLKVYNERFTLKSALDFEQKEKLHIEEMNQSKLRFFTNISHEFRTPISLILGQAETLLQNSNLSPAASAKVKSIHRGADSLKLLITELLDFRKQEQGFMKLQVSYVNFTRFLMEYFIVFQEYAQQKKIDFRFSGMSTDVFLWIDQKQMQKVVNNIFSNAFKNTLEGGKIQIVMEDYEQTVSFCINDTGFGIPEKELSLIFDRFYQVDTFASKSDEGTGIGLSLCKGIVESHHGTIVAQSQVNVGSTFTVKLHKGDAHFDETVQRISAVDAETIPIIDVYTNNFITEIKDSFAKNVEPTKLLVIEDNDDLRAFLVEIFSPLYQVHSASNGLDGFEAVRRIQPDIVISDIMMPGISGTELCSRVKKSFDTCHIPVILLTAIVSSEENLKGLQIGADDYITKPFDVKMLITRCNNLINNRRLLQKKYSEQLGFEPQRIATSALDVELLRKATEIVKKNLENSTFDVNDFARDMALGRTNLFAKIKGITGLTPNDFMLNIKLKVAAEYLINKPEMNIADITYELGYSSPRYFNKCFKELFGLAPNIYRQQNRNKGTIEKENFDE